VPGHDVYRLAPAPLAGSLHRSSDSSRSSAEVALRERVSSPVVGEPELELLDVELLELVNTDHARAPRTPLLDELHASSESCIVIHARTL